MLFLASDAPFYTSASIVNAADSQGGLAPNTIVTIYGTGLAFTTRAITADDIKEGMLPTVLPNTGVRVSVGGILANIYYVSPGQINLLVPALLSPGTSYVQVFLDGRAGPQVSLPLGAVSPALFQLDSQNAVAARVDGSVVTPDNPAHPGDIAILYATGLGATVPPAVYGTVAPAAAVLKDMASFQLVLDGTPLDPSLVLYAGAAPGFAGLYQINCVLPTSTGASPEIRIGVAAQLSKTGVTLPVKP
ncbi:MAG: hypothetical protein M3O35_20360 [Acidobacteriota bacterium]|nr:hypothetical protein [Acidobacteriota bacterium]